MAVVQRAVRRLSYHAERSPADALRALADATPADAGWDTYGEGGLVGELEKRTAELFGKEACAFAVSGKTTQLAALRAHADARGRDIVVAHPRSHIVEDENDAIGALYGLRVARAGSLFAPFNRADVAAVAGPVAAVVVEVPLRRAGYALTSFDQLRGLAEDARARGAAFHLDGARLWEVAPALGHSLAEIAALADTVYVSFYKGLGALAGGAVVGDAVTVAAARTWIARAGCAPYRMTPYAAGALHGLDVELPRLAAYRTHAIALAAALREVAEVVVTPDPPPGNAFVVHVRGTREAVLAARDRVAEQYGLRLFEFLAATPNPRAHSFEVVCYAPALEIPIGDVVAAMRVLGAAGGES